MTPYYRFDDVAAADPDESYPVELDLYPMIVNVWRPNEPVTLAEYRRPRIPNGFSYECTSGGTTSGAEPSRWPRLIGNSVTDGGVTWTCRAAASNGINPATSPSMVSDPTGMTISNVSVTDDRFILATYSGGLAGQVYDAVLTFTLDGKTRIARQRVNWAKQ